MRKQESRKKSEQEKEVVQVVLVTAANYFKSYSETSVLLIFKEGRDNANQLLNASKKVQVNLNQKNFENLIKIKYHKGITNKYKPQY